MEIYCDEFLNSDRVMKALFKYLERGLSCHEVKTTKMLSTMLIYNKPRAIPRVLVLELRSQLNPNVVKVKSLKYETLSKIVKTEAQSQQTSASSMFHFMADY